MKSYLFVYVISAITFCMGYVVGKVKYINRDESNLPLEDEIDD